MFGIGAPELVVILVVGLIFVGPDKLPKVAKTIGGGLRDLRRAANLAQAELKETVDDLIREADLEDALNQQPPTRREPEPEEDPLPPMDWELGDPTAATDDPALEDDVYDEEEEENGADDDDTVSEELPAEPAVAAVAQPVATPSQTDANRHPDPGFTFDDDPDDWDPDDWNDSAEPEDMVAAVDAAVAAHHEAVEAEQTIAAAHDTDPHIPAFVPDPPPDPPAEPPPAEPPPDAPPPDAPPPGPAGTMARSMPPMRAPPPVDPAPTTPPHHQPDEPA